MMTTRLLTACGTLAIGVACVAEAAAQEKPPIDESQYSEGEATIEATAQEYLSALANQNRVLPRSVHVPYLSDIPILSQFFQQSRRDYQVDASVLALLGSSQSILSLGLDEENNVVAALIDGLAIDSRCIRQNGRQVTLVSPEGDEAATLVLPEADFPWQALVQYPRFTPRVRIGIGMEDVPAALASQLNLAIADCVMISSVEEDGPAAAAVLQPYDVITHLDGHAGVTQESLREVVQSKSIGEAIVLHVIRQGKLREVSVEVEAVESEMTFDPALTGAADALALAIASLREYEPIVSYTAHLSQLEGRLPENVGHGLVLEPMTLMRDPRIGSANRPLLLEVLPRFVGDQVSFETRFVPATSELGRIEAPVEDVGARDESFTSDDVRARLAKIREHLRHIESLLNELDEKDLR